MKKGKNIFSLQFFAYRCIITKKEKAQAAGAVPLYEILSVTLGETALLPFENLERLSEFNTFSYNITGAGAVSVPKNINNVGLFYYDIVSD